MEDENRKPKALTKEEKRETNGVKEERIFKTKDLVFTAIIAFLIGAIIVAAGFAICGKTNRRNDFRNFRQDGIQRNMNPEDFDKYQKDNNNNKMQRPNMNNEQQHAPNMPNNAPNNQNTPIEPNNNNNQTNLQTNSNSQNNG